MIANAIALLKNSKSKFIIITFLISGIGFIKSFMLLKLFNLENLGLLALAQTFTISISLLQIGAVSGGYRLFAYKKASVLKNINTTVYVFFILLSIFLLTIGLIVSLFFKIELSAIFVACFIIIGLISLYSNWVICKLLGIKNIKVVNQIRFFAAVGSFMITALSYWFGINAAIAGLLFQPSMTIFSAYFKLPELIPRYDFLIFKRYFRKIINLGFIPYLTTALTLLNSQIGRWTITFALGTIVLGKTFLLTLFLALVSVFPNAVSNLFFPSIIENYELGRDFELSSTLKKHFLILIIYYILVISITLMLIGTVVGMFLPRHLQSVNLIYAIIPSIVFLNLSVPAIILFNAAKKFSKILYGSMLSVVSYLILLIAYMNIGKPQLVGFFIIESITAAIFFVYNSYHYFKLKQTI